MPTIADHFPPALQCKTDLHILAKPVPENVRHPFSHRNIILAHNGTIRDYRKLIPEVNEADQPRPEALDTEVYLHYVANFAPLGLRKAFQKAVQHIKKKIPILP